MFNEQLAVLLLVMANQVPNHALQPNASVQQPTPVERTSLQLRIDPRLAAPASRFQRTVQRRPTQTAGLFASN